MKGKTILILVLVGLLAILLIQNSGLAQVRLYFWSLYMPLFLLVLGVFILGLVVGFLLARVEQGKKRKEPAAPPIELPPSSPSADL